MPYRLFADAVLLGHVAFVAFVVLGGILVRRWPRVAWAHVPAVGWGVAVELGGWLCPLTPLESWLRARAGEAGHGGGLLAHYVEPVLYPAGLTREAQLALGLLALALNVGVYWHLARSRPLSSGLSLRLTRTPRTRTRPPAG